jgi:hypothetical protein
MKKAIIFCFVTTILLVLLALTNDDSPLPITATEANPPNDFDYQYDELLQGLVIIKYIGSSIKVRIPSVIEGEPVVGVVEGAFDGSGVIEVYIPDSMKMVEPHAFDGITNLTVVYGARKYTSDAENNISPLLYASFLPTNLPENPHSDFEYRYDSMLGGVVLTKYKGVSTMVRIPDEIEGEPVVSIGKEAFRNSEITNVYIPANVLRIGEGAFANCPKLSSVRVPDTVTGVGYGAFDGCAGLTNLTMPIGVPTIIDFGGMTWWVLDETDGKLFILSTEIQGSLKYTDNPYDDPWEKSDLREYLNGEYYDSFNDNEKLRIAETVVINSRNPAGTLGGNDTIDKVFVLSLDEVNQYLVNISMRTAKTGAWLRTPGGEAWYAAYIRSDGEVDINGTYKSHDGGVRPAMWIYLE